MDSPPTTPPLAGTPLPRRDLLLGALWSLCGIGIATPLARYFAAPLAMRATDPTTPVATVPLTLTDKPDWQSVVLEFAVEDGWARARPEPHLAYVRRDGTTVQALSSVCPHMGCQVIWAVFKQVFDCPCHGAQFDATGKRIAGPTEKALLSLPCEVDGDIIRVSLPGRDEAVAS